MLSGPLLGFVVVIQRPLYKERQSSIVRFSPNSINWGLVDKYYASGFNLYFQATYLLEKTQHIINPIRPGSFLLNKISIIYPNQYQYKCIMYSLRAAFLISSVLGLFINLWYNLHFHKSFSDKQPQSSVYGLLIGFQKHIPNTGFERANLTACQ